MRRKIQKLTKLKKSGWNSKERMLKKYLNNDKCHQGKVNVVCIMICLMGLGKWRTQEIKRQVNKSKSH